MVSGLSSAALAACLVLCLFPVAETSLAAMSIDFGSQFIKVGLVKPGVPMEIVLNKESRRKTPNLVGIRNNERYFGDAAQAVITRFPTAIYGNLLDLVAKNIDHDSVALFSKRFPHLKLEKNVNGSGVVFPIGENYYTVESLLAMILGNARDFTEAYAEQTVKDVVITVPVFFTNAERLAIEKAAQIARLNLLQLINDGSAAALSYGVFRRKEITEKPQRLMVYDMGSSKTTATLVEYKLVKEKYGKEPKMTVLGVGYDRTLGGLEMTLRMKNLLVEKFRKNYKTEKDITTSDRAMAKLFKEAERVKQVLSANADHYAQIESVHEDKDMKLKVSREEFESLLTDLEERIAAPVAQALSVAELKIDDVDQIVLMGAATRVPKVQALLQKAIGGKDIGRFLNTDEAAAMGALFQSAHLSKGFKVKPFNVNELVIFPVQVNFVSKQTQEDGSVIEKPIKRQIFQYKTYYPSNTKSISFTSFTDDFTFEVNYGDLDHLSANKDSNFGHLIDNVISVNVDGLKAVLDEKHKPEQTLFKGVKVGLKLDDSGIVRLTKAEATIERKKQGVVESITSTLSGFFTGTPEEGEPTDSAEKKEETEEGEKEEETVKPKEEEQPKEEEPKETKEEKKEEQETTNETEKNATLTEGEAKNATKEEKIPEVVVVKLNVKESYPAAFVPSADLIKDAKSVLESFERSEKLAAERAAAENELEAFAFDASLLLDEEEFLRFISEEEKTKLQAEVTRVRSWLEDDTTPETKTGEFKENHKAIDDLVRPAKYRQKESKSRPVAIANLESMINSTNVFVAMGGDGEKSLFNKSDTDALAKKLDKLTSWLEEKKAKQEAKKDYETPAVTTNEVDGKIKALDRELKNFMKKMRPERTVNLKKDKDGNLKEDDKATDSSEKTKEEGKEGENETKKSEEAKKTEL